MSLLDEILTYPEVILAVETVQLYDRLWGTLQIKDKQKRNLELLDITVDAASLSQWIRINANAKLELNKAKTLVTLIGETATINAFGESKHSITKEELDQMIEETGLKHIFDDRKKWSKKQKEIEQTLEEIEEDVEKIMSEEGADVLSQFGETQ